MHEHKIVLLIPAWNESESVGRSIRSALAQTVKFDQIIVIPNGCIDDTARVARRYPVTVMELPQLEHKKCEALNLAWLKYCQDATLVVTVDADTELEPQAVEKWIREFDDPMLGGSQAKFTMRLQDYERVQDAPLSDRFVSVIKRESPARVLAPWYARQAGTRLLTRLQKAEYALGIDRSLRRKRTNILAGASSCYRNRALMRVVEQDDRVGPFSYESAVEDFELTYQLRRRAFRCIVSPDIRAYTDSMRNYDALKGQRLKWQTGTIRDIMRFGYNKLTRENWVQQIIGIFMMLVTVGWISLFAITLAMGGSVSLVSWWIAIPLISAIVNLRNANRIPDRDWIDLLIGGTLLIGEIYGAIRLWWMARSWCEVLVSRVTKKHKDRWELQGIAEGVIQEAKVIDTAPAQAVL